MIRARMQSAILVTLAALGLLVPAWVAVARQAALDRPRAEAPAVGPKTVARAADLEGNWIVRGYPSGEAFGLIKIEGPRQQARATLLSVTRPDFYHFAESKVDRLRIDETTVRFTLHLQAGRPADSRPMEVIAYLPDDQANPEALWGSMDIGGRVQFPAKLERTDRTELDRQEGRAPAPGTDELGRLRKAKDPAARKEILLGMLAKYGDTPMAPLAAWVLAIEQAEGGAPDEEVRASIDRAARLAARYGREMEVGAINVVVSNLVGMAEREDLILEYARKAAAMLRPSDPINLQKSTLKNLASALRKATKIDEGKATAEANALDDRIANLGQPADVSPARADRIETVAKSGSIPWARNFATAREQARTAGKLIMVDFFTESCGWCKRLDSEVFPKPEVAEAMHPFVPVKVNAEDGEGRPLAERHQAHIQGYPAILFLDPAIDDPKDARIVGKIPGFMPPASFVEQLNTIAQLPKDVDKLLEKTHPVDGNAMRRLATALAMQGRVKEAAALIDRAWGSGVDPNFDRWASVYNTLGDEVMLRTKLDEAAGWYAKAARVAKRPIDVYNAHLGAGFVAVLKRKGDLAARELEAAARVAGVSRSERDFAKELLGHLVKPLDGSAAVPEAAAALRRLTTEGSPSSGRRAAEESVPNRAKRADD